MATIPSRKATFTEEEKRKLVEGTDAQGKPLSESEKMKLSKMHTARTLGADWRERGAERMKAEEPARAQQALAERAAINRSLAPREFKLPTKADEEMDIPGGGKVKIGAETLKRMQGFEKQRSEAKAAEDVRKQNLIYDAGVRANTALQKRYEDELASRGFAPPKTRQEAEAISRAKTEEFKLARQSREDADLAEKTALRDYSNFKQAAIQAKRDKDYGTASYYENEAAKINELVGGNIRNATARKSFFQDQASKDLMREVNARSEARKEKIKKETISNPEASSFTPKSTGAPLAVGSDMPSYQLPYQKPAGPTEQPFGMTMPAMVDSGVDFSRISPYNAAETRITETTSETARPTTRSIMPATKTSKQQTIEDVLPGASNMPVVQRNPNETPAQHNERVLQEYTNNVIIPSFDKKTQDAVRSAIELNKQKSDLSGQRYVTGGIEKYGKVSESLKKDQQVIIKSMKELKSKLRDLKNYPMNSKERTFLENQIGTLNNQLGFFDKLLN
jgi:hypothetical protein